MKKHNPLGQGYVTCGQLCCVWSNLRRTGSVCVNAPTVRNSLSNSCKRAEHAMY